MTARIMLVMVVMVVMVGVMVVVMVMIVMVAATKMDKGQLQRCRDSNTVSLCRLNGHPVDST